MYYIFRILKTKLVNVSAFVKLCDVIVVGGLVASSTLCWDPSSYYGRLVLTFRKIFMEIYEYFERIANEPDES